MDLARPQWNRIPPEPELVALAPEGRIDKTVKNVLGKRFRKFEAYRRPDENVFLPARRDVRPLQTLPGRVFCCFGRFLVKLENEFQVLAVIGEAVAPVGDFAVIIKVVAPPATGREA